MYSSTLFLTSALEGGPPYPRERPGPITQAAGWASGPVWTGVANLAPTRIRSPDRPARRQSL